MIRRGWLALTSQIVAVVLILNLEIHPNVEHKLATRADPRMRVTADEVREAVLYDSAISTRFAVHPEHGRRLLAIGTTYAGRTLKVVLQPVDEDQGWFACKTALVVSR